MSTTPEPTPVPIKEDVKTEGLFKDIDNIGKLFMILLGGSAVILFMILFYVLININKPSMSSGI